jgi:hypothetical protein
MHDIFGINQQQQMMERSENQQQQNVKNSLANTSTAAAEGANQVVDEPMNE